MGSGFTIYAFTAWCFFLIFILKHWTMGKTQTKHWTMGKTQTKPR